MSKQIESLMGKYPQVFESVSYEGNNEWGDGTWLYMNPSWYCHASDTGTIHEMTIADVLSCARHIYQDKERWVGENPTELDEIKKIRNGDYDK